MTPDFNAELRFIGRDIAFDDVLGGDLQMHADNVGTNRLLADMPVDQNCSVDPTGTDLRHVRAGAQERMAFEQHIIDHQQGGIGQIQSDEHRVLGQFGVSMQHLEIVGIALYLQLVDWQFRLPGQA